MKFKVGDIVTGTEDSHYLITTSRATMQVVALCGDTHIDVKIIDHKDYECEIGDIYDTLDINCFELVSKAEEEPKKLVRENFVVGDIIQDNFGERFTVYNTDGYGNILINKGWVSGSGFSFVNSNEAKIVENSPVILSTQHTISVGSNTLTLSTAELKALQSEIAKVLS